MNIPTHCPFCDATLIKRDVETQKRYYLECKNCRPNTFVVLITSWNFIYKIILTFNGILFIFIFSTIVGDWLLTMYDNNNGHIIYETRLTPNTDLCNKENLINTLKILITFI